MAADIHNLIAAISPDTYCDSSVRKEVKEILKKGEPEGGYLKAAEKAKPVDAEFMDFNRVELETAFALHGIKSPRELHSLTYDISGQPGELLEPIYFWILDYINKWYDKAEKIIDNFVVSPASSLFQDLTQKTMRIQEEVSRILGNANTVVRSILNIIYDLKEFKIRLEPYEKLKSEEKEEKESALLALKQIWLDQVDIKRGGTSIKQLALTGANQPNFVTLIDAFMTANSIEEAEKLDLNERVKRLVKQRLSEFLAWIKESEQELRKRFEVEKTYLKSQVNSVKLYARWAKPYLKISQQLEQTAASPAVVTTFNTAVFELTLLGSRKYPLDQDIDSGDLPKLFLTAKKRDPQPIVIVEFNFRSTPETIGQHHRFRGKVDISFTSYALNDDELDILKEQIEKDNLGDIFGAIAGATSESLAQIQADIDEFVEDEKKEEKKKKEDTNPFSSLFSFISPEKKEEKKDLSKGIPKDSDIEKVLRSQAIIFARKRCKAMYDAFKGLQNMPTF